MQDIVVPNNNEKEFISVAGKLGYTTLIFLYDFNGYLNKKENFEFNTKVKINFGILANTNNIYKINSKLKNNEVFTAIKSSRDNRGIIEKSKANLIFSLEESFYKDFMHQRASGLDHVMCKLAKENNIAIGFSINSIINSENKYLILGRIMQNIKLCRKYKVKTTIASFAQNPFEMRSPKDLISLFVKLGMHPKTIKDSLATFL